MAPSRLAVVRVWRVPAGLYHCWHWPSNAIVPCGDSMLPSVSWSVSVPAGAEDRTGADDGVCPDGRWCHRRGGPSAPGRISAIDQVGLAPCESAVAHMQHPLAKRPSLPLPLFFPSPPSFLRSSPPRDLFLCLLANVSIPFGKGSASQTSDLVGHALGTSVGRTWHQRLPPSLVRPPASPG